MKKIGTVVFCIALCLAVAFIFPQMGESWDKVDDSGCLGCHVVGSVGGTGDDIHGNHSGNSCDQCHDGAPTAGTVNSSACIECHPFGDAGKCPLVNFHDPDMGATCLTCHYDCEIASTTTTTAASTTTTTAVSSTTTSAAGTCPSVELYGEGSEEVEILRYLRDNVLSATPEGQEIIRLYYQWAPVITIAMNDEEVKAEIKAMVDGMLLLITE